MIHIFKIHGHGLLKLFDCLAANEVGELLKATMEVKRGAADSDSSSPSHTTIDLDDIPLNRIYTNLEKDLASSPSTKTTKKPDDVDESEQPTIDERIGMLFQQRIDICQNLSADHWLQPPCLKPLQTLLPEEDSEQTASDNTPSSHPKPTNPESP